MPFLRLTFDGGRFDGHGGAPVEVLKEFATVEQLIKRVAKRLHLADRHGRKNVAKGFYKAASLYITSTEQNCFTATLTRPGFEPVEAAVGSSFALARDLCLETLQAVADDRPWPSDMTPDELQILANLGRQLGGEEHLFMTEGTRRARIDSETRARLGARIHRPIQKIVNLEGEIEQVNDNARTYVIRTPNGEKYEAQFTPSARDFLLYAQSLRPLVRLTSSAIVQGAKVVEMDDLELVEDERFGIIKPMLERLRSFTDLLDGWAYGGGLSPNADVVERVRAILARVMVEDASVPLPSVFPTPEGGVQAEWATDNWAVEVRFDPQSDAVYGQSTHLQDDAIEREAFEAEMPDVYAVADLTQWLSNYFESAHV